MPEEPRSPPRLRTRAVVTPEEVAELARAVLAEHGKTHRAAAEDLGMHQPAITRALNAATPGVEVCTRIIEHYTDYTLTGPLYRVEKR